MSKRLLAALLFAAAIFMYLSIIYKLSGPGAG